MEEENYVNKKRQWKVVLDNHEGDNLTRIIEMEKTGILRKTVFKYVEGWKYWEPGVGKKKKDGEEESQEEAEEPEA